MSASLALIAVLVAGIAIGLAWVAVRHFGGTSGGLFNSRGLRRGGGQIAKRAENPPRLPNPPDGRPSIEHERGWYCEQLMDSANAGFFDWNLHTGAIDFGGPWMRMLGYERQDFLSDASHDPWLRLCHTDDLPAVQRQLLELKNGQQEKLVCELRMSSARDAWQWMRMDARTVERNADGKVLRILGTLTDIDAVKRAERVLAGERDLFSSGPVTLLALEAQPPHRLRHFSPNLAEAGRFAAERSPVGLPLDALLHPDDAHRVATLIAQGAALAAAPAEVDVRLAASDGAQRWYLMHLGFESANAQAEARADPDRLLYAYLVDINPLKEAEAYAAAHSESLENGVRKMSETQRFMQILQQLTDLLQLCESEDESRQIINLGAAQLFPGWSGALTFAGDEGAMEVAASWGEPFVPNHSVETDCWAVRRGRLHHCSTEGVEGALAPVCGHFGGGPALPPGIAHTICAPLLVGFDRPGGLHLVARDVKSEDAVRNAAWGAETLADALKLSLANLRLRTSLRKQAVHDEMTELYNRRYFDEVLGRELSRSQRTGDGLILAIIDIDHFKDFNDTFGHEAGDKVLRAVAEKLRAFVRAYDIACRVGGEELAIIMPRVHIDEARARLERLRGDIHACVSTHNGAQLPAITVSVGVADLDSGSPDDLLHRADTALYAAKRGGRNRLVCWEPSLEER